MVYVYLGTIIVVTLKPSFGPEGFSCQMVSRFDLGVTVRGEAMRFRDCIITRVEGSTAYKG